jgi:transposase
LRCIDKIQFVIMKAGEFNSIGAQHRRKQGQLGAPRATTATTRKLACLIYHLLKYKQPYQEPDPVIYQLRLKKSILTKLQRQAIALG